MAEQKNCSMSDLIKESILLYKQHCEIPENMQFSNLIHTQGAKAAIMTYRLLEMFIHKTEECSKEIVAEAGKQGLTDLAKWKIVNNDHTEIS
jgi:hypothetical protein